VSAIEPDIYHHRMFGLTIRVSRDNERLCMLCLLYLTPSHHLYAYFADRVQVLGARAC
jgi:hypothetical protein